MARTDSQQSVEAPDYQAETIFVSENQSSAAKIPSEYYEFENYVSKHRMMTFYHQISSILSLHPSEVLEIGVGPKVVSGTLREVGIKYATVDINEDLSPDFVGSIVKLADVLVGQQYDTILCARVLHHLAFSEFEQAIKQLALSSRRYVVLTLPVDDFRLYAGLRVTSRNSKILSIPLPKFVKRMVLRVFNPGESRYQKLWKIGSHAATSRKKIDAILTKYFEIEEDFTVPEDQSHQFYILRKKV